MRHIEDYALIGDCEVAALVARDGSIDWLCWPRFDSEACFAALLGTPDQGRWLIAPSCKVVRTRRQYRRDTLVLETELETPEGSIELVDFMPIRDASSHLVRIVVGKRGKVPVRSEFALRFDYGRLIPWIERPDEHCVQAIVGPHSEVLRASPPSMSRTA
jgi:Glucoamylase and related glycosyl hydrolases